MPNPQLTELLPSADEKAVFVRTMFDRIAPQYDTLNRLSFFLRLSTSLAAGRPLSCDDGGVCS